MFGSLAFTAQTAAYIRARPDHYARAARTAAKVAQARPRDDELIAVAWLVHVPEVPLTEVAVAGFPARALWLLATLHRHGEPDDVYDARVRAAGPDAQLVADAAA